MFSQFGWVYQVLWLVGNYQGGYCSYQLPKQMVEHVESKYMYQENIFVITYIGIAVRLAQRARQEEEQCQNECCKVLHFPHVSLPCGLLSRVAGFSLEANAVD